MQSTREGFCVVLQKLLRLRPIEADPKGVVVRYMAWGRSVFEFAVSLRTFARFIPIRECVVYYDPSYVPEWEGEDHRVLSDVFPTVTLIDFQEEIDRLGLSKHPAIFATNKQSAIRMRNVLDVKYFFDRRVILLDTDVFCFRKPYELLRWWDESDGAVLYNEDWQETALEGFTPPVRFNAGLVCSPGCRLLPSQMLCSMEKSTARVADQSALGELLASCCPSVAPLPAAYRCDPNPSRDMVTWHMVGGKGAVRGGFYSGSSDILFRSLGLA